MLGAIIICFWHCNYVYEWTKPTVSDVLLALDENRNTTRMRRHGDGEKNVANYKSHENLS